MDANSSVPGGRIPYPPHKRLGVIGDRRTAALVAADGDLCWMCAPNFDDQTIFGALLDFHTGGSWKLGPGSACFGTQSYVGDSFILKTVWTDGANRLELIDCMGFPEDDRTSRDDPRRLVLRHLLCRSGEASCRLRCEPRRDFVDPFQITLEDNCAAFRSGNLRLSLWSSSQMVAHGGVVEASFHLSAGDEVWYAFGPDEDVAQWSVVQARKTVAAVGQFWRKRARDLRQYPTRNSQIRRSALLVDLLTYAPTGSLLASPTTSLPARIGGTRNYDYRFCWIRDAALGLEFHSKIVSTRNAKRFIRWLCRLHSSSAMPLQVLYRLSGETDAPLSDKTQLYGYRGSRPVRIGNGSATSIEMDSFGYLMDSVLIYLECGGEWDAEFGELVRRVSDFTASNWRRAGASIWEISPPQQFVISRVMCWTALDRAIRIMDKVGDEHSSGAWQRARDEIHAEVMDRGWSEQRQSFRQRYGADAVDASLLLIPIVNFLAADHPKVCSTIERIKESLDLNGWLQRFVPAEVPGQGALPLGEEEGAFLMCSFWLARVHAMRGEISQADSILRKAELIAAPLGLFSECIDVRSNELVGNMPLLFSQVEYAKAAIALNEAEQRYARGK